MANPALRFARNHQDAPWSDPETLGPVSQGWPSYAPAHGPCGPWEKFDSDHQERVRSVELSYVWVVSAASVGATAVGWC
jgi:hypothetical protein